MGRRPVGTGPKRGEGTWARLLAASAPQSIQAHENASSDAGSSGLVSYGSDEEDEEQAETQVDEEGPLPDGWQEVIDQERLVKYYYNTLTEETTWVRPSAPKAAKGKAKKEAKGQADGKGKSGGAAGKGESQPKVDEDEEARKAALEAEDLFRSLETELLGQQEAEGMDQGAETGGAEGGAGQADEESLEPMEVSVLSPEELKKLSGAKAKLKAELTALCEAVVDMGRTLRRKDRERRSRLWKLEARLEDWRDGLLPSSSLVRRLRELGQQMEEEQRAQEEEEEEEEEEKRKEEAGEEREGPAEPAAVEAPTEAPVEAHRPASAMEEGNGEDGSTEAAVVLEAAAQKGGKATSEATVGAAGSTSAAGEDKAAAPVEWTAVWDPTHNAYYYYNAKTNETTWELPDTMTASASATGTDKAGKAATSDGSLPFTDKNTLIVFAGEHPEVTSAEGVSGTFPCSGRREVRELGVNYYCISFETPRATELAICVTNEGMDGDAAVDMAKSAWLRGRAGTFVRYPLPDDEPAKLALVDVGFKTDGAGDKDESGHNAEEQLASVGKRREQEAAALKAPSSAPLLKSGSAVVAGVVAKAPMLRKSVVASRTPQR